MRTRAFEAGVCSGRVVLLIIAHSLEYPKSELNCCTTEYYLAIFLFRAGTNNQYCYTVT